MPSTIQIRAVQEHELDTLLDIAQRTFLESHGHSASAEDLQSYMEHAFRKEVIRSEWEDPANLFFFILVAGTPIGYSKLIPHYRTLLPSLKGSSKLERIYLLASHHGLKLGARLLAFNIALSKELGDRGMWLYVWTDNHRAVEFYTRFGFQIIGKYDFSISPLHSNPNHQMLLSYGPAFE